MVKHLWIISRCNKVKLEKWSKERERNSDKRTNKDKLNEMFLIDCDIRKMKEDERWKNLEKQKKLNFPPLNLV